MKDGLLDVPCVSRLHDHFILTQNRTLFTMREAIWQGRGMFHQKKMTYDNNTALRASFNR